MASEAAGYLAVFIATLFFGSNFVPVKPWLSFDLKGATANRRALATRFLHELQRATRRVPRRLPSASASAAGASAAGSFASLGSASSFTGGAAAPSPRRAGSPLSRAQPSRARGRAGQPQQQGSPNGLE